MHMDPIEVLRSAFQNLIDRKVKPELMQDFIDRSRNYHSDNPEMLDALDKLQSQI
ncbi:hypothetical protein D3C74_245620 [compost metagenome]